MLELFLAIALLALLYLLLESDRPSMSITQKAPFFIQMFSITAGVLGLLLSWCIAPAPMTQDRGIIEYRSGSSIHRSLMLLSEVGLLGKPFQCLSDQAVSSQVKSSLFV